MAREKMVTREVSVFTYEVMFCDTVNASVSTTEVKTFVESEKKAIEAFNAMIESGIIPATYIPVKTTLKSSESAIYGMTETEFMKHAKKIKESR